MKNQSKLNDQTLTSFCLHMLLCGTILIIGIITAYVFLCTKDGFLSVREIQRAFEYFFICITELLIFSLAFDIIYKYEKAREV